MTSDKETASATIWTEAFALARAEGAEAMREDFAKHHLAIVSAAYSEGQIAMREAAAIWSEAQEQKALAARSSQYVPASISNPYPRDRQETRNKHLQQVAALYRDVTAAIRAIPIPPEAKT